MTGDDFPCCTSGAHEATTNSELKVANAELVRLRVHIESVIDDLNRARANGTVYTYGNIQFRLRQALTQSAGASDD